MDELYDFMHLKLKEMQDAHATNVVIECADVLRIIKMICYAKQIRQIVEAEV